jgi:hypothetical protein
MPRRLLVAIVALWMAVVMGGIASAESSGDAIAFARIRRDAKVSSFGGSRATSASGRRIGQGHYEVVFKGSYPGEISPSDLVVITSTQLRTTPAILPVSNANATRADHENVVVEVEVWDTATEEFVDDDCYVAVFLGRHAP